MCKLVTDFIISVISLHSARKFNQCARAAPVCIHRSQPVNSRVMSEVTRVLSAIEQGDPSAAEQLLPLVYDELRQLATRNLAQEKPGQTLQATALVHEAYLRLVDVETAQHWNSRGHFFAAAAEAMRRILVDQARRRRSQRRGGAAKRHSLAGLDPAVPAPDEEL